jgi:hypothetical protein
MLYNNIASKKLCDCLPQRNAMLYLREAQKVGKQEIAQIVGIQAGIVKSLIVIFPKFDRIIAQRKSKY